MKPKYCSIIGCFNTTETVGISFHFCKYYANGCIFKFSERASSHAYVCSIHFEESCFLGRWDGSRLLRRNSVPTLFLPTSLPFNETGLGDVASFMEIGLSDDDSSFNVDAGTPSQVNSEPIAMNSDELDDDVNCEVTDWTVSSDHIDHNYYCLYSTELNSFPTSPPLLHSTPFLNEIPVGSSLFETPRGRPPTKRTVRKTPISKRGLSFSSFGILGKNVTPSKIRMATSARALRVALQRSERKVKQMRKEITRLKNSASSVTEHAEASPILKLLLKGEIINKMKPKHGRRWTRGDKADAASILTAGRYLYELMGKTSCLPSKSTVMRLLKTIPFGVGLTDFILNALKKQAASLPENNRLCTLAFDEMAILPTLLYQPKLGNFLGFGDLGNEGGRLNRLADHALVFMLQGVCQKWKIPIAYYFTCGTIKTDKLTVLLPKIIRAVSSTGFSVVATVCDMGSTNIGAFNALSQFPGGSRDGGFFTVDNSKIYAVFDPPHLLKATRNNLLNHDFHFGKGLIASWKDIEEFYSIDSNLSRVAPKLTDRHIYKNLINKMKVSTAANVLSHSVYAGMHLMAEAKMISPKAMGTAEFVKFMDTLFDSFNGETKKPKDGKPHRICYHKDSPHNLLWLEAIKTFSSLKLVNKEGFDIGKLPFMTAWLRTLRSMKDLCHDLQINKGIEYIATRRFNQDPVENLFSCIRRLHPNPNINHFAADLKTMFINKIGSVKSTRSNCLDDKSEFLSDVQNHIISTSHQVPTPSTSSAPNTTHFSIPYSFHCGIFEEIAVNNRELELVSEVSQSAKPGEFCSKVSMAYVSGFIAKRLSGSRALKACQNCRDSLVSQEPLPEHKLIVKKEYRSTTQSLCYPSVGLNRAAEMAGDIFLENIPKNMEHESMASLELGANFENKIQNIVDFTWIHCSEHREVIISCFSGIFCRIFFTALAKRFRISYRQNKFSNKRKKNTFAHNA